jgi:hypothetical protein
LSPGVKPEKLLLTIKKVLTKYVTVITIGFLKSFKLFRALAETKNKTIKIATANFKIYPKIIGTPLTISEDVIGSTGETKKIKYTAGRNITSEIRNANKKGARKEFTIFALS